MNGSGRKHSSKWDSRDEPEFAPDSVASSNSSKWSCLERNDKIKPRMGFSCKETSSGGRGSNRDDFTSKDYRALDETSAQNSDRSCSMEMSPELENWRSKKYSQSPKNGFSRSRSRSRSRSPPRGFRWDSGVNDRYRMRAGELTQPCRDFAAGKCRRGSQCHFLHHDNQNYEDSWEIRHRQDGTPRYSALHENGAYSRTSGRSGEKTCINYAKGRCRMGASCKYVHHDNSDRCDKVSVDESNREREIDRRRAENSFEQGGRHVPNRNGDIPCKFFAFGNCRNGNHCRFSHDRQACGSPNRRLRDDRSRNNQGGDQALDMPKLSDEVSPNGMVRDDRWGLDGSLADVDKVWDRSKHNDLVVVSDMAKLVEDSRKGIMGTPEPGLTAWPMSDGLLHSLDKNRMQGESPFSSDKKEANCWTAKNDSANIHSSQSVGADIWPGNEKMSPDWNYGVRSSSHIKEEHGQSKQQVAPGHGFDQNVNALNSSNCHAVGQSQAAVSIVPPRVRTVEGMQNQEFSADKMYIDEPNIMDANLSHVGSRNPPTQNMVSKEQLAQLTSLSASLADILGTGRQLPPLFATSISQEAKDTPSLSKTEESGKPVSITFIKPDPAVGFQEQCDSMATKNANANGVPPSFSPIKKIPKDALEIPSLLSKLGQQFDKSYKSASSEEQLVKSEQSIQLQKGENVDANKENNEVVAEGKQSSRSENKITGENDPLENMDHNGGSDEAKKIKDVKGVRAFKFSLVEFVKELLKPTWKEGKITKEDYKAIVKKVTDKVTGTMQQAHIPQTQEKIDRYLSISKPKLNKLIQAYVEKVQKA